MQCLGGHEFLQRSDFEAYCPFLYADQEDEPLGSPDDNLRGESQ